MRIIHIVISISAIIAGIGWISAGTGTMIPLIAILGGAVGLYMIFSGKQDWDYRIDEIDSEIEVIEDQIKYLQKQNLKGKGSEELIKLVDDEVDLKMKLKKLNAEKEQLIKENQD